MLYADFDNGYDAWSPENGRITFSDNPGRDEQRTTGAALKVTGPLGKSVDFVSISGYAQSDILFLLRWRVGECRLLGAIWLRLRLQRPP